MIVKTNSESPLNAFFNNQMNINIDGMAHHMMIDGIYSNKLNSVIREICTNAHDSHITAGIDKPLEIVITPVDKGCKVVIEDFGVGLSTQDSIDYLCTLNASSKRDSNDVVGCFGIGSKSVYSLTDKYSFECVKDGVKTFINLSKDLSGTPDYSHTTTETSEPNGVTCTFICQFSLKEILLAIYSELTFFKIKPVIKIVNDESSPVFRDRSETIENFSNPFANTFRSNTEIFVSDENEIINNKIFFPEVEEFEHFYTVKEDSIDNIYHRHFKLDKTVVCGGIGYSTSGFNSNYPMNSSRTTKIVLKFELGEINFGISREIIDNTPETNKNILEKTLKVLEELEFLDSVFELQRSFMEPVHSVSIIDSNLIDDAESVTFLRRFKKSVEIVKTPSFRNFINKFGLNFIFNFINYDDNLYNFLQYVERNRSEMFRNETSKEEWIPFQDYLNKPERGYRFATKRIHLVSAIRRYIKNYGKNTIYELLDHEYLDYKVFPYNIKDYEEPPTIIYSHKALGSDTFLHGLDSSTIGNKIVIKMKRASVESSLTCVKNILDIIGDTPIYSIDEYREIDLDLCKSLKPVRAARDPNTASEVVTVSPDGLKLRTKMERFSIYDHKYSYRDRNSIQTVHNFDETYTSSQLKTELRKIVGHKDVLIFPEDAFKEGYSVKDISLSNVCVIDKSDCSDVEEVLKILRAADINYHVLDKEMSLSELSDENKTRVLYSLVKDNINTTVTTKIQGLFPEENSNSFSYNKRPLETVYSILLNTFYSRVYNLGAFDLIVDKLQDKYTDLENIERISNQISESVGINLTQENINTFRRNLNE